MYERSKIFFERKSVKYFYVKLFKEFSWILMDIWLSVLDLIDSKIDILALDL